MPANVCSYFCAGLVRTDSLCLNVPPPSMPDTEGCDHTWRKFHGHCYRYFSRRHTWEDAEKDCREHSGHLASIHSPAEQNFIRGRLQFAKFELFPPRSQPFIHSSIIINCIALCAILVTSSDGECCKKEASTNVYNRRTKATKYKWKRRRQRGCAGARMTKT